MIFKKPYAFLIKYFKLINLALAILSIYITYRSYNIISFFNEYITQNYSGNFYPGFSDNYISLSIYVVIILIIIGISFICLLFKYKKKPIKEYLTSILYFVIFFIFLTFIKNIMVTLETNVITAETARIYRDLSMISIIPQPIFIILFLVRGLGFNLKKFDFKEDLKEMEISEQDSEEVEITIKRDGVKLKRNIRRFGREFIYYIKENKFIFIIICICLTIAFGFLLYKSLPEIVDKNYNQGDTFNIGNLVYKVEDSIITNIDYKGESLGKDTYYVVTRLYIENTSFEDTTLDYNNFRLLIGDSYVYPVVDKGSNFIDYAENFYGKVIKAESKQLYSLVFKIKDNEVKKNYDIKISRGSALSGNQLIGSFNYVTITPIVINKVTVEQTTNKGEEISFVNSNLGNSKLTLSNPIITDKYLYDYEYCVNSNCKTYKDIVSIDYTKNNKLLLILDYEFILDKEIPYYKYSKSINTFVDTFMKIRYSDGDEFKYYDITNVTPSKLKNKIVLETTNKIKNAEELAISITIRNKEYIINLK